MSEPKDAKDGWVWSIFRRTNQMQNDQDEGELTELQSRKADSNKGDKKREEILTNPLIGQMNGHKIMCKKCSVKECAVSINCATDQFESNKCEFPGEENSDETWTSDDNDSEETKIGVSSGDSHDDNSDDVMLSGSIATMNGPKRRESKSLRKVRFGLANVMRQDIEQSEEEATNAVKPENKGKKRKRGRKHELQRNKDSDTLRSLEITKYWDEENEMHKESGAREKKARNARRARQRQRNKEEKQKWAMEEERKLQKEQEEKEREQEEQEKCAENKEQENKHYDYDEQNANLFYYLESKTTLQRNTSVCIIRIKVRVDYLATVSLSDFCKMLGLSNTGRPTSLTNILHSANCVRNQIDNIRRSTIQIFMRQKDVVTAIHMRFTVI